MADPASLAAFRELTRPKARSCYHERWVKRGAEWKLASLRSRRLIVEFGNA